MFFESGLELFEFECIDNRLIKTWDGFKNVLFEFSCCGIDINSDSTLLAIGDLSGVIAFHSITYNKAGEREIKRICRFKF